ncbi:MAG TPA: IclR family transcriptional regulator [Firmicutes bacterium]|jgi:IclR family transcriptional regulator, KDG regulon repressor|nr:IclR family transcriptional regulator [Bacillota bacterium]
MPSQDEVNSVNKAFAILKLFQKQSELGITEIAYLMGMAKGSVYRFVTTLKRNGLLEQNLENEKYRPAVGLLEFSSLYVGHLDWRAVVHPFMELLSEKTQEDILLAVLNKSNTVYIDKIEGKQMLRMVPQIGFPRPAHCTGTGKALLAELGQQQLLELYKGQELIRYTENTITSFNALLDELALIQKKGYAFDNEEFELGVVAVASSFRGINGVLGSLSVSGPRLRFSENKIDEMAKAVIDICNEISRRLGWREGQIHNNNW